MRVRDKNNARKGKGAVWKGHREVNWAEGIDNHGERDNHSQVEHGNEGDDDYQDNWGIRHAM